MIILILKASIVLAILLGFYKLVLEKESFFAKNRYYLIGSLLLTFILPFIALPKLIPEQGIVSTTLEKHVEPAPLVAPITLGTTEKEGITEEIPVAKPHGSELVTIGESSIESTTTTSTIAPTPAAPKGILFWVSLIYWFGVGVFALQFLAQLVGTWYKIARNNDRIEDLDSVILNAKEKTEPCSFFKYIFIHPESYDYETYEQILAHEKIHIRQGHTLDLLIAETAKIFLWFNPLIWQYRKEIEKNIEYETDQLLIRNETVEKEQYQMNLLKVATFSQPLAITTNYNQSLIKQRILKMNAKKSNLYSYWKYAFIAPLVFGILLLLNKPVLAQMSDVKESAASIVDQEQATFTEAVPDQPDTSEQINRTGRNDQQEDSKSLDVASEAIDNTPANTILEDNPCKDLINAVYIEDAATVAKLLQTVDPNCIDPKPEYIITKVDGHTWKTRKIKTALVAAGKTGNLEIGQLLINAGADVNLSAQWDDAPLTAASESGNLAFVKLLVDKGAEINTQQKHIGTALMRASERGHLEIVKYLMDRGAEVQTSVAHVGTALILAAREGHIDIAKYLFGKGAMVNASVANVGTPLILAARDGHVEMVKYLIGKGADFDQHVEHVGTPLILAAREGRVETVEYLLSQGADINKQLAHVGTPVLLAAREGKVEVLKLLLAKGADMNITVAHVGTPLIIAAREGQLDLVKFLIGKGADVNKHVDHVGTALALAAKAGHYDIVKYLAGNGADIDQHVAHVGTALILASREGQDEVVDYLLANGADINKGVAHVGTPLIIAAQENNIEVVKSLIRKGAEIDKYVAHVGTPLIVAARGGSMDLVQLLVEKGADLDKEVAHVGTPLIVASRNNEMDVVKYLVRKGANINKHVAHVGTPLSVASADGRKDMVEYLIEKGAR